MYTTPLTKAQDEAICSWHDSQTEEFLSALPGAEGGLTPRQAYIAVIGSLPGQQDQSARLAASAQVDQVGGTKHQKGGALLLLLVAIICFVVLLKHLDTRYPCGLDPVDRMNCKQEQGA